MKRVILFLAFSLLAESAILAQASQQDLAFKREMEIAADLMEIGAYDSADTHLRHVIQNMKVLPTNISYYFGKNSLYLKRYKQSINWLNKYIELTGTSGQFFDESVKLLEEAETNYREERKLEIAAMVEELQHETKERCQENDMVICPICRGLGVVVKEKTFGKEYWPCPFSDDRGRLSCSEYNLLIAGKLKPKN